MNTRAAILLPALAAGLCTGFVPAVRAAGLPAHLWSQHFGTAGSSSRGFAVAVDGSGNVVLAGSFTGSVSFGGSTLTAQNTDIVLAKYNPLGAHVWSKRFGGMGADQAYAVAVDDAGNILVTGYFQEMTHFGGSVIWSAGSSDLFVAKYDPSGTHLWSNALGTADADIGYSIAVNATGDAYVTGYYHGIVPSDIIVLKYGPTGTLLWGKIVGGEGYDEGIAVDVDLNGNVIVTGSFAGTVDFGGGELSTSSVDEWDVFVAKYDPAGTHLWSRRFGNADLESGLAVKADPSGNVLLTGYFSGTVNFGGSDLTSASADLDIFLAKYAPDGAHVWSRRFGGISYETATALAVDASSNVFLAGYFYATSNFGGANVTSAGNVDIFFAEYRSDGSHVSSQRFGGVTADYAQSIAVDDNDNRTVTGYFDGTVDFGGGPMTSSGTPDIFLVKYGEVVSAVDPTPARGALSISAAPNPFNPSTSIHYRLPAAGRASITVYDVQGRAIATLVDRDMSAGAHAVQWNGRDRLGSVAASGVYFARIEHAGRSETHKLVLLK